MIDIKKVLSGKVVLAPLAGYTNIAYRKIAKEMGAVLVYSEMVSAKGLIYDNDKTMEYLDTIPMEHPIAIQIFGGNINEMVEATKIVCAKSKADIIDINMGCPVKKVLKQDAGSALLREPSKIYEMVKAVVEASTVPVSVKIRAGWTNEEINCVEVAKLIEKAGASLIAIHGRTKSDLYSGHVNLDYIKMVKDAVSIPVIGNGDIKTIDDAKKMLEYTGVDAIMVGRATLGNPWFIRNLVNYFNGSSDYNYEPDRSERIKMIKYHFEELKKIKDEHIAILEIRSLAAWYVKGLRNVKRFKLALNKVKTSKEFYDLLKTIEVEGNDDED